MQCYILIQTLRYYTNFYPRSVCESGRHVQGRIPNHVARIDVGLVGEELYQHLFVLQPSIVHELASSLRHEVQRGKVHLGHAHLELAPVHVLLIKVLCVADELIDVKGHLLQHLRVEIPSIAPLIPQFLGSAHSMKLKYAFGNRNRSGD